MMEIRFFITQFDFFFGSTIAPSDVELVKLIRDNLDSARLIAVQRSHGKTPTLSLTAEERRLVAQVEKETRGKLAYQGRQYKLVSCADYHNVSGRDGYAVVPHAEASAVLEGLSKEKPAAADSLKQASKQLTPDWRKGLAEPDGLVLLRKLPVVAAERADDSGPITPSQMKAIIAKAESAEPKEECRPCATLREAKQAEALRQAAQDGSPFCADCGRPPEAAA
jgi:hypothetical protein